MEIAQRIWQRFQITASWHLSHDRQLRLEYLVVEIECAMRSIVFVHHLSLHCPKSPTADHRLAPIYCEQLHGLFLTEYARE